MSSYSILLLTVSCVAATAVMEHNSYYPGGHSTSYYTPMQMHTYGSKYYNTESFGKYDEHGKESHYQPNYYTQYNPIASYYHSYAPKYDKYEKYEPEHGKDYYSHNTPYYGSYYHSEPKHNDFHGPHHIDMH